ncbi:MAG: prepilin-type N-terminal cleavage/methylation domain-containing protein [Magnetococcales bacterium]|nr:prepilin-type N-terminal cleavage/methylation domain-containing protein [Magnetococcales bacterium]
MYQPDKSQGFTLVELMVVVTIISLLVAFALPSYSSSVRKSRRSDAQQLMVNMANRQEQYLMDALSYTSSLTTLNFSADSWTCTASACSNSYYSVAVAASSGPPPSYTITATPSGSQLQDGTLTLSSTGAKTLNGVAGW